MDERERDPRDRIYWREGLQFLLKFGLYTAAAIVAWGVFGVLFEMLFESLTGWQLPESD